MPEGMFRVVRGSPTTSRGPPSRQPRYVVWLRLLVRARPHSLVELTYLDPGLIGWRPFPNLRQYPLLVVVVCPATFSTLVGGTVEDCGIGIHLLGNHIYTECDIVGHVRPIVVCGLRRC